jgi:uncharacterized lipoprotein YmbA
MLRVVRAFCVVPALLPVLLLGACASAPGSSSYQVDQQKVAAVDRAAAGRGVKVYWISMPTKRVNPAAAAATPG